MTTRAERIASIAIAAIVLLVGTVLALGEALVGASRPRLGGGPSPVAPALLASSSADPLRGPTCDRATGLVRVAMHPRPACVPTWDIGRDNGGATARGVTADTVRVVVYVARDTTVTPEEREDERARLEAELAALMEPLEHYGRDVELIPLDASGAPDDPVAAHVDGVRAAEDLHAFASLGGPLATTAYVEALASAGVLCIHCAVSPPQEVFDRFSPYLWGETMSSTSAYLIRAEWIANRLDGRRARWAGSEELSRATRRFALVYYDDTLGSYKSGVVGFEDALGDAGVELAMALEYHLDASRLAESAASIIAKLAASGVTSVLFSGDPIMPAYLTDEATRVGYRPEWIVTGSAYSDTAYFARSYDPAQWRHAFGLSTRAPFAAPGSDPLALRDSSGREISATRHRAALRLLLAGIHLAGPRLSAPTFRDGMFSQAPSPSDPVLPSVSYGTHAWPWPDFTAGDDVAEIWWDADAFGPDETTDAAIGRGRYRFVDGGRRLRPGSMPSGEPCMFDRRGTVMTADEAMAAAGRPTSDEWAAC